MELKIDHKSCVPLHSQVEQLLRKLIKLQEYIDGKLLPNETALASRLGISRNTLRAGIDKLVYDRLLERKRGVGTKVVQQKVCSARLGSWISFTKEMEKQGINVETFYTSFRKVKAHKKLSEIFSIKIGTEICCLERVKGYKGIRVLHSISYFHPRIGLREGEDFTRPLYDILESEYDVVASNSFEKINAVCADKVLSKFLHVKEGFPLLCRDRTVTDPGGRVIEYNIHHHRSDKFVYTVNIERG
jgi:GntR family transcriptional regulator